MRISLVYVAILIIFIIILMAGDIGMPMTLSLIGIVIGVMTVFDGTEYMEVSKGAAKPPAADSVPIGSVPAAPAADPAQMPWRMQDALAYPADSMINQAQTDSYSMCYEPVRPIVAFGADLDSSADGRLAYIGMQRARDKKALDGAALKDATFYSHYYDDELSLEENRPWWGRSEY